MSSYLTIKWADAKPGEMRKPEAAALPATRLQMAVEDFDCVREAKAKNMPSVVFVFSEAKEKRDLGVRAIFDPKKAMEGKEELTSAAKTSLTVYERVFENVQDLPLRILMRFFQCTRMDVTKVPAGTHPDIAEPGAPLILIVDAQGKVSQALPGTRIDSRAMSVGMLDVLRKGGIRDIDSTCTATMRLMDEMEKTLAAKAKLEVKMEELRKSLADYEAKDRKRPNKSGQSLPPSASTERARKAVEDFQPLLDAADKTFAELKQRDAAIIRSVGKDLSAWQAASAPSLQTASVSSSGGGDESGKSATMRTWTSASGRTLEGRFMQLDRDIVVLAKPDGGTVKIQVDKLSAADQDVARRMAVPGSP